MRGCPPAAEAQAKELREASGEGGPPSRVAHSGRRGQQGCGTGVGKESGEPEATPCSRLQRARPAAPDSCPPGWSLQPTMRQPWARAQHLCFPELGCPACPRSGAAALCKAAFSLRPNISPEQSGPGVGGPLPLARGALLRPQRRRFLWHRPRDQAPPSSGTEEGRRQPSHSQFPAHWADSGLTPQGRPLPAAPGPTEPVSVPQGPEPAA